MKEQNDDNQLCSDFLNTPLGKMIAIADSQHLYYLGLESSVKGQREMQKLIKKLGHEPLAGESKLISRLKDELDDYFKGSLREFSVPVKLTGSDFQKECWEGLMKLKYGETSSYGELARTMGRSSAHARAVGGAAGANNIIIIVPCHRLKASGDNLGGFSCGIDKKTWLLDHEAKYHRTKVESKYFSD